MAEPKPPCPAAAATRKDASAGAAIIVLHCRTVESVFDPVVWWAKPEWRTVWLTLITLGIVFIQLQLMLRQDEIIARRHKLQMLVVARKRDPDEVLLDFRCGNIGSRGARDFYWHMWVPQKGFPPQLRDMNGMNFVFGKSELFSDGPCWHFQGISKEPLYPTREAFIGTASGRMSSADPKIKVFWQCIAEDGAFPLDRAAEIVVNIR